MPSGTPSRIGSIGAVMLWLSAVGAGFYGIWRYETTPARSNEPPPSWPRGSRIERSHDRPTLVIAVHPRCPCTRASIRELAELMAQVCVPPDLWVLIYRPATGEPGWEQTDLCELVRMIPNVKVMLDVDGMHADQLGMVSSGHALLYDAAGHLAFSGGLTNARGQAGAAAGRQAIQALLLHKHSDCARTPVFGCSLQGLVQVQGGRCVECPK